MCTAQAVPSLARGKQGALDLIPRGVRKGPLISLKTLRLDVSPLRALSQGRLGAKPEAKGRALRGCPRQMGVLFYD